MEPTPTPTKRVALVAHDARKDEMVDWARRHRAVLEQHALMATGTTGHRLVHEVGLEVECLRSGPFGGDQQIGCRIAEGRLDALVFLWDPLEAQPHEPDVRALLRIAVVWDVPVACNRATADLLVGSPLFTGVTAPAQPAA